MRNIILLLVAIYSSWISAQEIQVWSGIEYSTVAEIKHRFEAETTNTLAIREFDVNNIRSELLLAKQTGITVPDVIWVPSDFLGLHDYFDLAAIPSSWIDKPEMEKKALSLVTVDGAIYGIPLGLGNHLVLYVNTKLTNNTHPTWETLIATAKAGKTELAMQHPNMYFFMAFISMFSEASERSVTDIDIGALSAAFQFYSSLIDDRVVIKDGTQDEARQQFIRGKVPYLIDGDWALSELKHHFGSELEIHALPTYSNHKMHSLSGGKVLAFTTDAMSDPEKKRALGALTRIVQKPAFIKDVIINQNFISTNHAVNRQSYETAATYYGALYKELKPAYVMPSTVAMAVTWEALIRGYKRYQAGMPATMAATFVSQFIEKHSQHINHRSANKL